MSKVYIVLVNWNGWRDTLECLESLLNIDYPDFQILVCDNGSGDKSLPNIVAWANGTSTYTPPTRRMPRISSSLAPKPVPHVLYSRDAAERGGQFDDPRLVLIDVAENLGFAGGNNVGLRYAIARGDMAFSWLLNNDTVVEPSALSALVCRMKEDRRIGICGSVLVEYRRPEIVQALGGAWYSPWTTRAYHIGAGARFPDSVPQDPVVVEMQTTYVVGASMLVSLAFLEQVGLMREDYFLYGEELDWAARAKGKFHLGFASASIVYHKVGASTPRATFKEAWALELLYKNKLLTARRFFRPFVLVNYLWLSFEVGKAMLKGDCVRARSIFRALLGRGPLKRQSDSRIPSDTPSASGAVRIPQTEDNNEYVKKGTAGDERG